MVLATGNLPAASSIVYSVNIVGLHGGGTSAGGGYTFTHTIGQLVQGNVSGGIYSAQLGFFPQVVASTPPDLALTVVVSPNPVTDASNLTYTVAVTNRGGGTATGTMLTVPLPSGITFVSATASQGSCTNTTNGVQCSLGTLQPGGTATVNVVGIPDFDQLATAMNIPEMQETISVSNTATVASADTDATPTDNVAAVVVGVVPLRDFGDAPDSYHTLAASNGPRHRIRPGWRLGALVDAETNGAPTVLANGDDTAGSDDDDGVIFLTPLVPGLMASNLITVTVPAGSNAYLNAWYDFNGDGVFDGTAYELGIANRPVTSGTFTLSLPVPPTAVVGPTYARFRLSAVPGLSPEGPTSAGEVEDYAIQIVNDPPTVAMTSPLDGSSYNVGAPITLTATATAFNGKTVASVTFIDGATDLATVTTSPYTTNVSTLTPGTHVLRARVADSFGLTAVSPAVTVTQIYLRPTYSSPIAISQNDRLIWVVNPSDDSVSVIRPDNNTRLAKITVGDEPESIALTPNNQYAYVANAAGNNVTVIRINDPAWGTFSANVDNTLTTGAEPWNIVMSPDGLRVFVANSAQDTITVINAATRAIIGHVDLRNSIANDPDRSRHFQPRGLAVTGDNTKLYVTRFLSFTKPGGRQGDDLGKEGLVAVLDINTSSLNIADYSVARTVALAPQITGFQFPGLNNPPAPDTFAFANQMQSIVIRGDRAYLPNIAASPTGPLRFNLDTHAFINQIGAVNGNAPTDLGALNLHLGARDPEPGKRRLFFANAWAIAFTSQSGAGSAYAVSAASDLLVKLNVAVDNSLSFTGDADTTRYIDLNEPTNAVTSGLNAGKNPQGIAINSTGTRAYVANFVSRNVSVVDLTTDTVIATVRTSDLPTPGSQGETNLVGAEMFFSSRGNFDPIPGTNSLRDRLSSEGWQSCASCHFKGLTDGVVWQFAAGPRKSVPLNSSFNPLNRNQQRLLNYSAIFDEVEDFEINVRNISGPGALAGGALDPNHGLLIGDNGDLNVAPSVVNGFALPNANRPQVTVTLPGSANKVPALTAMREWVRFAVRTPNAPVAGLPNAPALADIAAGRTLFSQAGCVNCHGGPNWTISLKDFTSPPASAEIFTERTGTFTGNPVGAQYLNRFLRDIGSFNLGVPGQGNPLGNNVGADEKAAPAVVGGVLQAAQDGLGIDYNADGKGAGFNVPSLLGLYAVPPYMHNGAAESLAAVVADVKHRTDNGRMADLLSNPADQARVVKFLESIDVRTVPLPIVVFINEWMAANTSVTGIADPADGHYEDWFELYNPGSNTVDLAGYFLTDTLTDKFKFQITSNMAHSIPPRGYLLVWADDEVGQNLSNGVPRLDLHVNFTLAAAGEGIGLFAADGTQIDAITFSNQANNVSEGRSPDGSARIIPLTSSPRAANGGADTTPPMIACPESITRQAVSLAGAPVNFTVTATDDTDSLPIIVCTPPSGSTFPAGTTTVNCVAMDDSGNNSSCTFIVTVVALVFRDSEHLTLGNATLSLNSNGLVISNLVTCGEDGVTIDLHELSRTASLDFGSNGFTLPPSGKLTVGAYGTVTGTPEQFLGSVSFAKSNGVVSGVWTFDVLLVANHRIEVYSNSTLVGTFPVAQDGSLGTLSGDVRLTDVSLTAEPGHDAFYDWEWWDFIYTPPGQPSPTLTGNRLRLVYVGSSNKIDNLAGLIVSGCNIPSLLIQEESAPRFQPTLRIEPDGTRLRLNWDTRNAVLFSAPTLDGPWTLVLEGTNSTEVDPVAGARFYKTQLAQPDDWAYSRSMFSFSNVVVRSNILSRYVFKRNILLFIMDDVGVDQVPWYINYYGTNTSTTDDITVSTAGNPATLMPTFDRLAASGVTFLSAWASPLCSPSRASLITGRCSFRHRIYNALGPDADGLSTTNKSISQVLADSGYTNGLFGKWHLGEKSGHLPSDFGFYFEGSVGGEVSNYYAWDKAKNGTHSTCSNYATLENVTNALDWIRGQTNPWMATVAFNAPHWAATNEVHYYQMPPLDCAYQTRTAGSDNRTYYRSMLECLDRSISNLLSSLDSNVLERTTIVIMGDNGTEQAISDHFVAGNFPSYGTANHGKSSLYEGGVNVPLVIADGYSYLHGSQPLLWGGRGSVHSPNRIETNVVQTMDLFATFAAIGRGDATCGADSVSMLPYLWSASVGAQRDVTIAETLDTNKWSTVGDAGWDVTVRNNWFKLVVRNYGSTRTTPGNATSYELYNLVNDRWETADVYGILPLYTLILADLISDLNTSLAVPEPCP
jgi:uncharacterized repeat protein (TIGR01451 family)